MLLTNTTIIEYVVDTPKGSETLTFTFPGQTDPIWQANKKKFLDNRYIQKGRKMVNVSNDARIALFDANCTRVDTLEEPKKGGGTNNIMDTDGWQAKVPVEIKVAIIAQAFEEKESLSVEDQEDLSPASDGA